MSCTIVLVHGAFAESSSWDGVIDPLVAEGHRVVAAANPLRGLAADAQSVSDLVRTIEGPVVLVAHSYGGAVISNVDAGAGEIAGLVYVNAFAPEPGENWKVFGYTMVGLGVSLVVFLAGRVVAKPPPPSMTKEWQEATNERLRVQLSSLNHC